MTKRVLAIDPGKLGGIATISRDEVRAMPLIYNKSGVDAEKLLEMMMVFDPSHIIIERQWTRPGQGGVSSGTTMYNYGILRAVSDIYVSQAERTVDEGPVIVITPTPRKWQKLVIPDAKKGETKAASINFCVRRYPQVSLLRSSRCRKKSDGLSDALCMAHAGYYDTEVLHAIS